MRSVGHDSQTEPVGRELWQRKCFPRLLTVCTATNGQAFSTAIACGDVPRRFSEKCAASRSRGAFRSKMAPQVSTAKAGVTVSGNDLSTEKKLDNPAEIVYINDNFTVASAGRAEGVVPPGGVFKVKPDRHVRNGAHRLIVRRAQKARGPHHVKFSSRQCF